MYICLHPFYCNFLFIIFLRFYCSRFKLCGHVHVYDYIGHPVTYFKELYNNNNRDVNGFPSRIVYTTIEDVKRKFIEEDDHREATLVNDGIDEDVSAPNAENSAEKKGEEHTPFICVQYKGQEGELIMSKFRKALKNVLPKNVKPRFTYKGKKTGSFFRLKDKVPIEHKTNLVYAFEREDVTKYVGHTGVRFGTRTDQHCNSDKESSVYKFKEENQIEISEENFKIIDKGYPRLLNRRIAEALFIKDLTPELNAQKKSAKLLLFN